MFRYLQDGSDQERKWHVPIFLRAGTKTGVIEKTILLADGEQSVELGDPVEWAVVNAGGHGFYRVRYGADLFDSLKHGLQVRLSAVERFSLVNDTWASTLAGLTSLIDYLSLIDLLSDENDVNVWTTVIGSGHHLRESSTTHSARHWQSACARSLDRRWRASAGRLDRVRAIWKASFAVI